MPNAKRPALKVQNLLNSTATPQLAPQAPSPSVDQGAATASQTDKAFMKRAGKALRAAKPGKSGKNALGSPKVINLLRKAVKHQNNADYSAALQVTLEATALNPDSALGYHMMAMALDHMGETHKALLMYEKALELDPTEFDVYLNLGLTARKLHMDDAAEKFFRIYIDLMPEQHQGYNNLGALFRDQNRFDDAIEIVRHALNLMPGVAELWNTMGTIAAETERLEEAELFYNEALNVSPNFHRAHYNLSKGQMTKGEYDGALTGLETFLKNTTPAHADYLEAQYARSIALLAKGRLEEGWRENRVRNNPRFRTSMLYASSAPLWNGEDICGKNILVIGEQGVGDEIMFANPIGDLIERVGPDGNVLINVTKRLVPLFQRTYPQCLVGTPRFTTHNGKDVVVTPWESDRGALDYHVPMGDLSIFLRPDVDSYRRVGAFLRPDSEHVKQWKEKLDDLSDDIKVGLCWRSGVLTQGRGKAFAPLAKWAPVFKTRGVTFINLQYGDVEKETREIKTLFGRTLHQMEGLDVRNDLDGNAALCSALDLVITAPTAAAALAASVGTRTWYAIMRRGWPSLGEKDFPIYPDTMAFEQETMGDWDSVFASIGTELETFVDER